MGANTVIEPERGDSVAGVLVDRMIVGSRPGADADAVRVRVEEYGRGRTVVFLQGLVGLNVHWMPVVRRLREHLRCVLVEIPLLELRGHACSLEGVAGLVRPVLGTLGVDRLTLLGSSFGGHVAVRLTESDPGRVRGLVLAGASGLSERALGWGGSELQIKPTREWVRGVFGAMFHDPKHIDEAELTRVHGELIKREHARAIVRLTRSSRRDGLEARLPGLGVPTMLIWGRQDAVTPPEACERFASLLPRARTAWIDRCGHAPMVEHPDEFAACVLEFVRGLDPSGLSERNG
ncbi:MAG: alpha/beta hydrolase [Phycisphaerae bacterium]|nr:alpha/beta hydrolase [Phycisphaerae bacterium]